MGVTVNDPHVEELIYYLETRNVGITFQDPPPLEDETDAFSMLLEDGVLTNKLLRLQRLRQFSLVSALRFSDLNRLGISQRPARAVPGSHTDVGL